MAWRTMWTYKLEIDINDDRDWSDYDLDDLSEQLGDAGLDDCVIQDMLNDIIKNVVGRNDVRIHVREV